MGVCASGQASDRNMTAFVSAADTIAAPDASMLADRRDISEHTKRVKRAHDARVQCGTGEQQASPEFTCFKSLTTSLAPGAGGLSSKEWRAIAVEFGISVNQANGNFKKLAELQKEVTAALQGCVRMPSCLLGKFENLDHVKMFASAMDILHGIHGLMKNISDEAKIGGRTPDTLTFNGRWVD